MDATDSEKKSSDFGQRLKICLAKVGKNYSDLAKKLGYNPSDVSKHVSGEREVSPKTVTRYIEALRDWGLAVEAPFFYVPWEYIGFYDPKRTDNLSVHRGRG